MAMTKAQLSTTELLAIGRHDPRNLDEATAQLRALRHNARVCTFLFARCLAHIRDHELYLEGRHPSLVRYCHKIFPDLSAATLFRALAFADSVPADVALAHDPVKIDAGARLLKKNKLGDVLITKAALEALTIPVVREGQASTVLFKDASPEEVLLAAAKRRKRLLPPVPQELKAFEARCLRRFGAGDGRLADVRVQHQGTRPVAVITVDAERLAEFERLFRNPPPKA